MSWAVRRGVGLKLRVVSGQRWELFGDVRWGRAYKFSWRKIRVVLVF